MTVALDPSHGRTRLVRWLGAGALAVAGVAVMTGLAVMLPGLSQEQKDTVDLFAFPLSSVGAGLILILAACTRRGERRSWLLLGSGVLSWGVGEVIDEFYWAVGRDIPYPGYSDIFYLGGYVLLAVGVWLLPRLRLGKYERTRSLLDAAVGVVAIAVVTWITYLDQFVVFDPEVSLAENWVNLLYPAGDLILLLAIMVLAFCRTERRFAIELTVLAGALAVNALADVLYFGFTSSDTYAANMWIDGMWLLGYGLFAGAAWLLLLPPSRAPARDTLHRRRVLAAYAPVLALLLVILISDSAEHRYLTLALVTILVLIAARQWMATREVKEITEGQRDAMLASVSHEMRTPLTAVQGYAQLLSTGWREFPDDEREEMIRVVRDEAVHLGRIVTDIIDLSRGRTSAVRLDRGPQSVEELVGQAVRALPADAQKRISVEVGRQLVVDADPHRLRQILSNLLTNAVRYGRDRVLLTAQVAGRSVVFQVHDDGDGVPKRFETAIWQRFERGAHAHDPAVRGLGVGLPMARAMVEAHGGSIHYCQSRRLGGACFQFTIPAPQSPAGPTAIRPRRLQPTPAP